MKKANLFLLLTLILSIAFSACTGDTSQSPADPNAASDTTGQNSSTNQKGGADLEESIKQYEPPDRVVWQKPEFVINKMGDLSEKTVADIGAASGFFSRRLTQHAKKVIAIEVDPKWIPYLDSTKMELKPEYRNRLETRLATPTDSKLKPGEADIILIVNTYIYIQNRGAYLRHLLDVLPKGGQIIIVDFKKKRMPIRVPPNSIRLELFEVENELVEAGFSHIISDDQSLDYQYIVIGEK
jgi:SAM-dependent methyltransferase